VWRRAAGLLTRGSPSAAFPALASGVVAEGISPHSGGTVPELHRVPFPRACFGETSTVSARSTLTAWVAVVAWAGVIFAFSSIPSLGTGLGTWDLVLRKLAHLTEFAILGLLLARVLPAMPAFAVGVAYAASDELHQHFVPGRQASAVDLIVDAVGVAVGVVAVRLAAR
jgi:VanZ family protein